jgi:malate dehydrogenase (oxaloacetate-decarboxylating)(NADP+)
MSILAVIDAQMKSRVNTIEEVRKTRWWKRKRKE